jgi:hypothetical protein
VLLNNEAILYTLDLILLFLFFHRMAASTLARPTTGGAGFTTIFNAIFLVASTYNGTTTNRT